MKILINRKPVDGPWGGGNLFVKYFSNILTSLGHEIIYEIQSDIDIFFIMNPRYDQLGLSINEAITYKNKFPNTKIIQRINDCDARKGTKDVDNLLIKCSEYLDGTIFVSEWMKNYFLKKDWKCKKNFVLVNGVNTQTDKFKKIKNGKINIVTHHWSNNYLKGFDIYEKIDQYVAENKEYTFTYIGRERGTFQNTNIVKPLHGKELYQELKKYDLYISASRFDPGPNHILESISCKLPTYVHKDGGGCVEFAGNENTFNNFSDLVELLVNKKFKNNKNNIIQSWKSTIENLENILREINEK